MKITTTIDLKNNRWSGVKKHVEHDPNQIHGNGYLNSDESRRLRSLNRHRTEAKLDATLEKYFGGKWLKDYNQHQLDTRHKERCFKDGADFAKSTGSFDKVMVATFGDKNAKQEMIDAVMKAYPSYQPKQAERDVLRVISTGLIKYANGFNRRNKAMTMTDAWTNVDELGAPHLHSQIICHGHTAKGKPSTSIDSATLEMGFKGNARARLAKWREREDKALVKIVSKELRDEFTDKPRQISVPEFQRFDLWRKGEHNGLTQEEWKDQQDAKKLASSAARAASAVDARKASLTALRSEISAASSASKEQSAAIKAESVATSKAVVTYQLNSLNASTSNSEQASLNSSIADSLEVRSDKLESRESEQSNFADSMSDDIDFLLTLNGGSLKKFKTSSREFATGDNSLDVDGSGEYLSGIKLIWKLFKLAVQRGGKVALESYAQYQKNKERNKKKETDKDDGLDL